jgi:hypothetical protein
MGQAMMTKRIVPVGLLAAALMAGACTAAPTFSVEEAATAVAATVAALAEPTATGAAPTAEEHSLPTAEPTAAPAELSLAYTDGGNVAYLAGDGPAVMLMASGAVEQVRLSDDGRRIAYSRRPVFDQPVELRTMNSDGSGDALLMGPADFDALYPLDGALHHDLSQFEFIPGSHTLLINTYSFFEGPGLAKHDDLLRIDSDTLARTMLLAPGTGGDFAISPDGRYLALTRPDTVEVRLADGSASGSGVISYQPVITYSEYAYYAQPVWNPESSTIGVAIPSADPLAPSTSGTIWRLPVGASASLVGTISGQFFLMTSYGPLISFDLTQVVYTRPTSATNVSNLYRASVDGSGEALLGTFTVWMGWSPDSSHFVFSSGDAMSLLLGDVAGGSSPLVTGTELRWFSPEGFVYLSGSMGAWTLQQGGIGAATTPLAPPIGDFIDYDLAYR